MSTDKIGKYKILGELGRGAMGVVYKGEDPLIGRIVAVKTIRMEAFHQTHELDEATQRFIREAQSAGNLSHPNIVTIYDVGEDEGMTFIAMEYIEGQSLAQVIASKRGLSLEGVINLIAQIGDALDYAHQRGVVHRDIKPANILLDNTGRAHIVDFGIARISTSTLTQTGTSLGTPSYMSPEQVAGRRVDHKADIFALGAILYEMLTFEKPFSGDSFTTIIYKIMNEDPPPLRTFDARLPEELDLIIRKALAKKPEDRYMTCRQLANDLSNYQIFGRTLVAETPLTKKEIKKDVPPSPPPRVQVAAPKDTKKKPIAIILGSMAVVVAAVLIVIILFLNKSKSTLSAGGGRAAISPPTTEEKIETQTPAEKPTEQSTVKTEEKPPAQKPQPPPETSDTEKINTDVARLLDSGTKAFNNRDYDACIQDMEAILKLDPQHSTAEYFLAEARKKREEQVKTQNIQSGVDRAKRAFESKNYEESIRRSLMVLDIEPNNRDARNYMLQSQIQLGIQDYNQGKYEEAVQKMEEVLKLDPRQKAALDYIERAKEKQAELLKNLDIENTLQQAEEAYRNQDYQESIRQTEKVLILNENNDRAKEFWSLASLKIGTQFFDNGEYEECIQQMESILKLDPQNNEARSYIQQSRERLKARQVDSLLNQAQNAFQADRYEDSLNFSRRAKELDPANRRAEELIRLASLQLAPKQINAIVGEYIQSVQNQSISNFYENKCTRELYQKIKTETELIMKMYSDLKLALSNVSIQFKDATHAVVTFSHVLTGVSRSDKARSVLSEGTVLWEMERQNEDWKIIDIQYSIQ